MKIPVIVVGLAFSAALCGESKPGGLSPAEERIAAAEKARKADPKQAQAVVELAEALCRRARETGDASYYSQAEQAANEALQLSPGNFEAGKAHAAALLGEHEFAKARTEARALNRKVPDDLGGHALVVDTNVAIGNYAEAEKAAQWILDLRVGSALAFKKAAELRQVFGDNEGAVEFFHEALRRTLPRDLEERAWILTKVAEGQLTGGNVKQAAGALEEAFKIEPEYEPGLLVLARLRMREGKYAEAASALERCYRLSKDPAVLYEEAAAMEKAGRHEEAESALKSFAAKAAADSGKALNANRQLIFYYADGRDAGQALALAEREVKIRHDVATLDAQAWALYANARYDEAKAAMDKSLAVGNRDAATFCRAARIAAKTNDAAGAKKYTQDSEALVPGACGADASKQEASR